MKKHNKGNLNMILLGIIIPALVFFAAVNITYAYFTAKCQPFEGTTSTGSLQISLSADTQAVVNNQPIVGSLKVLPGDELNISGTVENAGSHPFYAIFSLEINVKKSGASSFENLLSCYYTIDGSTAKQIEITTDEESGKTSYSSTAFRLEGKNEDLSNEYTLEFALPYTFDGNTFDNTYQNATINYVLKAIAIQSEAIGTAAEATKVLIAAADDWVPSSIL